MEVKKNDKANIEHNKGIYFQLGLVIAISLSLIAFEWSSGPRAGNEYQNDKWQTLEPDIIPNTEWPEEMPDTPPEVPSITEVFEIVEDGVKLDNPLKIIDDLFKEDEEIPPFVFVYKDEPDEVEDTPFIIVEDMPTFRGGDQNKFAAWVQKNIVYPQIPAENGVSGKVFVEFVVEPDGSVSNIRVVRNVDPALDAEAVRVISNSPKWVAGKQLGIPVRVCFTIVVNFQLQ